jgi:hypothetical protein
VGSWTQFLIKITMRSKFFEPNWQRQRFVRMPTIENTFSISIWLPWMPRIVLTKKSVARNCPLCFDHQRKGLLLLPRAHQMWESMTIHIEPTFTHIIFK